MDIINYQSETANAAESGSSYNPDADSWIHGVQHASESHSSHDLNQNKQKSAIINGRVINRAMLNLSSLLQKQYYSYAVNNDMAICRNSCVAAAQDNYISTVNSNCTAKPPLLLEAEECSVSTKASSNSTVLSSSVNSSVDHPPCSLLADSTNSSSHSTSYNSVSYAASSAGVINALNQKPVEHVSDDILQSCAAQSHDYVVNSDRINVNYGRCSPPRRSYSLINTARLQKGIEYSTDGEAQHYSSRDESDSLIEFIPDRDVLKTSCATDAEYNLENQYSVARKLQSKYQSDGRIDVRMTAAAAAGYGAIAPVHRNDSKVATATSARKLHNNNVLHSGKLPILDTNYNNMAPLNYNINYSSADQYNCRRPVPSKWDDAERWLQISKPEAQRYCSSAGSPESVAPGTRRTYYRNQSTTDRSCHGGSAFSGRTDRSREQVIAPSSGITNSQIQGKVSTQTPATELQTQDVHVLHRVGTATTEMEQSETDRLSEIIDVCQQEDVVRAAAIKLSKLLSSTPTDCDARLGSSNIYCKRSTTELNMQNKATFAAQLSQARALQAIVNMKDAGTEVKRTPDMTPTPEPEYSNKTTTTHDSIGSSNSCCSTPEPEATDASAAAQESSPPRHNTPARRSSNDGPVNVLELESCHLAKLNLAPRDAQALATWLKQDDDASTAAIPGDARGRHVDSGLDTPGGSVARHVDSLANLLEYNSKDEKQQRRFNIVEARAAAWEDVEKAKYTAKFKREEAKIEAWESLQRTEADAELRKLEAKLEKLRFEGRERILGKLSAAQKRAQEMRAAAEAHKAEQIARVSQRANLLRRNGQIPGHLIHVCFTKKPSSSFLT